MSKSPPLKEWEFPPWLVCVCDSAERFEYAKIILRHKFGFVDSPFDIEKPEYFRSLVLPRPDISIQDVIARAEEGGDFRFWGVGRVRFDARDERSPRYELKYFPDDCPWEYIQTNPMKAAAIELHRFLNPKKFLDYNGREIPFPYEVNPAVEQ